ncbi:MAG: hypothetical protein K6B41_01105 [Butyrivibrio sp.]|nr:hypothetical protein [Butyrivibrio sp.]
MMNNNPIELSGEELEQINGGVTRRRKSTAKDIEMICNKCFWEPGKNDIKCTLGSKCPKCHEGKMIAAKG